MSWLRLASPHDIVAVAAIGLLLVGSHLLVSEPLVRYAVWLVVFCIWMVWFVSVAVRVLPTVDR